jgi:hypothetical protein
VQKYWRININVLDFFLQYLDRSIAARLHGMQSDAPPPPSRGAGREAKANDAKSNTVVDAVPLDANSSSMSYPRVEYDAAAAPALDLSIPNLGPGHYLAQEEFREQYLGLVSQGDDVLGDWDLLLQGEDFSQTGSGFNVLERSL